jgi:hypothetical protein
LVARDVMLLKRTSTLSIQLARYFDAQQCK